MSKIKKIKKLALCGGGFFGIAQVAALRELEKLKDYHDIQEIRGVSVGSMIAALLAVGYTADEMTNILFELDFGKLIKDNYFAYYTLGRELGMYRAAKLETELERLISIKTNIKFCTFSQISKDLTIISTNLNKECPRFFNRENSPDLAISKAIRMSIGYPVIMTPILFEGDYYSDGGESINYPITTIENLDDTLGIAFAAHNENIDGTLKIRNEINNLVDYLIALGLTMNRATYISQLKPEHMDRSVIINITENINSMQLDLTREQKQIIYDCGTASMQIQLKNLLDIPLDEYYRLLGIEEPGICESVNEIDITKPDNELDITKPDNELDITKPVNELDITKPDNELDITKPDNELDITKPDNELDITKPDNELDITKPDNELDITKPDNELDITKPDNELDITKPVNELDITEPDIVACKKELN